MSEATLLAIITVSCTAASTLLVAIIKMIENFLNAHFDYVKAYKQRKLDMLESYSRIVQMGAYSPMEIELCRIMGAIYIYIPRNKWHLIDTINQHLLQGNRNEAVSLFGDLLSSLKLPDERLRCFRSRSSFRSKNP